MSEQRQMANYHMGYMTAEQYCVNPNGKMVIFKADEKVIILATIANEHDEIVRCVIMKDDETFESCTVNAMYVQPEAFGVNVPKFVSKGGQ